MQTFNEIYTKVQECSSEMAFSFEESKKLYDLIVNQVTSDDLVVEIGIEWGRSTTIFAELAKDIGYSHVAIDNFSQENGNEYKKFQLERQEKYDWHNTVINEADSKDTSKIDRRKKAKIIFIDADHEYNSVKTDIEAWLPYLKSNGYMLFHDYGRDSLPGVYKAVSEAPLAFDSQAYTLGVFKK